MLAKLSGATLALALLAFVLFSTVHQPPLAVPSGPLSSVQADEESELVERSPLVALETPQESTPESEGQRLSLSTKTEPNPDQAARPAGSKHIASLVGRVVTFAGQPIQGAEVVSLSKHPTLLATTNSTGEFEADVPYLLNGSYLLRITASDFYTREFVRVGQGNDATPMVPGSVGKPTVLGDIQLQDALVLRGRVVGEDGQGLGAAWAWVAGASRVQSTPDGTFRMPNVPASTQRMSVRLPGHANAQVDFLGLAGSVHDVGDVILAAESSGEAKRQAQDPACTFRIVDSKTGEGLLEYRAQRDQRSNGLVGFSMTAVDSDAKYMKRHSSPEISLRAVPREDKVTFAATGYRTRSVLVKDEAVTGVQIIRMKAAPRVHGRVVRGGEPVPFAEVVFTLGEPREVKDAASLEDQPRRGGYVAIHGTGSPLPKRRGPQTGRASSIRRVIFADEDGSFSSSLPKESAGMVGASDADHLSEVVLFQRSKRGDVNVGDLELLAPCKLIGRVEFSGGEDPSGTTVELLGRPDQPVETDEEGRFEFDRVPQGDAFLTVKVTGPLQLESGMKIQRFHTRVESGGNHEVVLAIKTRATTMVEFTVTINGAPAAGYRLGVGPVSDSTTQSIRLDGAGKLSMVVSTGVPLRIYAKHEGLHMYLTEEPIIQADQRTLAVDLNCGSLALTLPSDITDIEGLVASITPDELPGPRESVHGQVTLGEDQRIEALFQGLSPGSYGVSLTVKRMEDVFFGTVILERELTVQIAEGETSQRDP